MSIGSGKGNETSTSGQSGNRCDLVYLYCRKLSGLCVSSIVDSEVRDAMNAVVREIEGSS